MNNFFAENNARLILGLGDSEMARRASRAHHRSTCVRSFAAAALRFSVDDARRCFDLMMILILQTNTSDQKTHA